MVVNVFRRMTHVDSALIWKAESIRHALQVFSSSTNELLDCSSLCGMQIHKDCQAALRPALRGLIKQTFNYSTIRSALRGYLNNRTCLSTIRSSLWDFYGERDPIIKSRRDDLMVEEYTGSNACRLRILLKCNIQSDMPARV